LTMSMRPIIRPRSDVGSSRQTCGTSARRQMALVDAMLDKTVKETTQPSGRVARLGRTTRPQTPTPGQQQTPPEVDVVLCPRDGQHIPARLQNTIHLIHKGNRIANPVNQDRSGRPRRSTTDQAVNSSARLAQTGLKVAQLEVAPHKGKLIRGWTANNDRGALARVLHPVCAEAGP